MSTLLRRRAVVIMVAAFASLSALAQRALGVENPFELARKSGQRVEVWLGEPAKAVGVAGAGADDPLDPPMLRRIHGLLGELKGKAIEDLRRSVETSTSAKDGAPVPGELRLTIRIDGKAGRRDVAISLAGGGLHVATADLGKTGTASVRLKSEAFDRVLAEVDGYWGGFEVAADLAGGDRPDLPAENVDAAEGTVFEVPKPYVHGRFAMDAPTLERLQGSKAMYSPTRRKLADEKLYARLPAGHSKQSRSGVLIWMDPSPDGRAREPFWKAADELNLICIGAANAGNERPVVDRLQLAFDALATAARRWPIDPERVYLTGISGGGKMSSLLLAGFPEVFAGAVPIVGLCWYESLPTGEGRQVWPPEFVKPSGARLEQYARRRMAVVTGVNDFNYKPILKGVELYQRDKLPVRLFDIPGLGHTAPRAEEFAEALGWVDEERRQVRDAAENLAAEKLGALPEEAKSRRGALLEVIRAHPWTQGAWGAVRMLEAEPGR